MTTINRIEFTNLLRKHGWRQLRQEGNHQIWKHESGRQERIAFPAMTSNHGDIGDGLAKELLTRFGLAPREGSTAQMVEVARGDSKTHKPKAAPGSTLAPEGSFGRRVAEARIAKGWSQGELARRAGITQGQISAWERGASSPFAADGHISFKHMKPRLATLADLLGFRDILEKTGPALREGPPKIAATKPAQVLPEAPNVETDLDHELAALRKRHPDQKAFSKSLMRLLQVSDVMEWLIDQENIRRRQEVELEKYRREDAAGMRRKAQAYDAMRADAEALLARMKEAE